MKSTSFGEIVESSLTSWRVHCWQWDVIPAFGSLVITVRDDMSLFGIVGQIQSGSIDSGRFPYPYQKTEEELLREQPQIFSLLQTQISCCIVGYHDKLVYHQLPPRPPKIHTFVRQATADEIRFFCARPSYIPLLYALAADSVGRDELMLAMLKNLHDCQLLTEAYLHECVHLVTLMGGGDYRSVKLFLRRVQHFFDPRKALESLFRCQLL